MPTRYEIVVMGDIGPTVLGAVDRFELQPSRPGTSRLIGSVTDDAALHGVLHRLTDLRVELLEVRRLDD